MAGLCPAGRYCDPGSYSDHEFPQNYKTADKNSYHNFNNQYSDVSSGTNSDSYPYGSQHNSIYDEHIIFDDANHMILTHFIYI